MTKPQRIALIVTQLEAGGAQRVALDIADGLRGRGHVVETIFLYEKSPAYREATGVRVLEAHRPTSVAGVARTLSALRRRLQEFAPDATISFTHYANIIGSLVAATLGVRRRIVSQQNPAWSYPRLARMVDRVLGGLGLYTTSIAVSRSVARSFESYPRRYRRVTRVVRNGSLLRASELSAAEARASLGLPTAGFLAVAVGRLAPQKNHRVLLRALEHRPETHLAIAGDGELRAELVRIAEQIGVRDRLTLLGSIPADSIPTLLRAADAFVMPSHFEGLSLALLEALAAGIPVIASNIPPQVEVLTADDGSACALLLDADDAAAWSGAIALLQHDDARRRRLANAASQRAREFSIDNTVAGYEAAATGSAANA